MSAVAPATRKTARKAKGDGHLRRAEILEAAERIFVAEGYEGATIRKIADEFEPFVEIVAAGGEEAAEYLRQRDVYHKEIASLRRLDAYADQVLNRDAESGSTEEPLEDQQWRIMLDEGEHARLVGQLDDIHDQLAALEDRARKHWQAACDAGFVGSGDGSA